MHCFLFIICCFHFCFIYFLNYFYLFFNCAVYGFANASPRILDRIVEEAGCVVLTQRQRATAPLLLRLCLSPDPRRLIKY